MGRSRAGTAPVRRSRSLDRGRHGVGRAFAIEDVVDEAAEPARVAVDDLDELVGVVAVVEKLKGHPLFAHVTLTRSERSPIAALVTDLLEDIGI